MRRSDTPGDSVIESACPGLGYRDAIQAWIRALSKYAGGIPRISVPKQIKKQLLDSTIIAIE